MQQLRLSALNSTKTAFASFVCEREPFFESYEFTLGMANRASFQSQGGDRFYCQILLKVSDSFISSLDPRLESGLAR